MQILDTDTSSGVDISAFLEILSYMAAKDFFAAIDVYVGDDSKPIAGDETYELEVFKDGVSVSGISNKTLLAGETKYIFSTVKTFPVRSGEVVTVKLKGKATDTDVNIVVRIYENEDGLEVIKGTTWSAGTDTLEDIRDAISTGQISELRLPLQAVVSSDEAQVIRVPLVINKNKVSIKKGQGAILDFQMQDKDENPLDLTSFSNIVLNAALTYAGAKIITDLAATVLLAIKGEIRFTLTSTHTDNTAGTYKGEIKGTVGGGVETLIQFDLVIEDAF